MVTIELCNCENQLLREIEDKQFTRRDVAKTYRLALQSSESKTMDWAKVNGAIIDRWSFSGLDYIKKQAWTGKCFQPAKTKRRKGKVRN